MEIRELRIYSIVKWDGKNYQIFGIREYEKHTGLTAMVDIRCLEQTTPRDSEQLVDIHYLSPILLTEDILLKCGFNKRKMCGYDQHFSYGKYIGGENINITAIYNADFSLILHGVARKIQHLHRLQNIIFDITGEELKIEL